MTSAAVAFALADYERVREAQKAGAPHPDPDFSALAAVETAQWALDAILDCHTRILAAHPPSPKRQAKRAAWRKNAAAFAARHRAERRGK